jgi:hypothetical protein
MNWNLEGLHVTGLYMDEFPVAGLVTLSRVKYGGDVQHTVVLDEPIKIYGIDVRERVLLDHKNVTRVQSNR